jgi:hypothetical protein
MSARDELSELQARGIAAASEVFDRLAEEIGGGVPSTDGAAAGGDPVGEQRLRAAGARLVDLFAGLFQDGIEAYLELAQGIVQRPPAGASSAGAEILCVRGAAGGRATTTVWIHNAPQAPAGEVVLRLTDLESADGGRIDGSRAAFAPRRLHLDAGASMPSLLTLAIPPATAAGTYVGHVLAAGLPAGGLPLRLVVESAEG